MGVARAPNTPGAAGAWSAMSSFDTESGAINGDSLAVGGVWATSGAATDFSAAAGVATRTTTGDASVRYALVDTNMTATVVDLDFKWSVTTAALTTYLMARVVGIGSDYLILGITGATSPALLLQKAVGSVGTTLLNTTVSSLTVNQFYTLRLAVYANGQWQVYLGAQGSPALVASGSDSALATGGAIATGDVGFADTNPTGTACTRTYDNFSAFAPTNEAAIFSGKTLEFRADGETIRQSSDGTVYGRPPIVRGAGVLIPQAGSENKVVRIVAKARRNDIVTAPSDNIADSTKLEVRAVPRWLVTPR